MAPIVIPSEPASPAFPQSDPRDDHTAGLPSDAITARRRIIAELDAWCRRHDSPHGLNTWIAEEAIRRCW
jgi:hypothetical protein